MAKRSGLSSIALLVFIVHLGCVQLARGNEDFSEGCLELGLNAHPRDSRKYLVCREDGYGNLKAIQGSCPEQEVYSDSEQTCVPESEATEPPHRESDPRCGGREENCKDCFSMAICAKEADGTYQMIGEHNCTAPAIYCDNKMLQCTNVVPIQCFHYAGCTSEGIFPSIINCSIYYICKTQGDKLVHTVGECQKGYVFNPFFTDPAKPCRHRDSPEYCITVKCRGVLEKLEYAKDSSYYVLCTKDDAYVFWCGKGVKYDPKIKQCERKSTTANEEPSTTVKSSE